MSELFYFHIYRVLIAIFLIFLSVLPELLSAQVPTFTGRVARITDGDTFHILNLKPAVRLWGLDAPERADIGGTGATEALKVLLTNEELTCALRDVDRFGRIVAQCFLAQGRDIAAELIRLGVAMEYCRYSAGYYGTC